MLGWPVIFTKAVQHLAKPSSLTSAEQSAWLPLKSICRFIIADNFIQIYIFTGREHLTGPLYYS